ncbi:MAG: ADP-forming succinate--CoA ligase subunit beta, partial [Elusimicrobiales bacterium]|nr:ADP-forming succinate--CoA ligase subunit beta [Elusimicrobiales bacterium]
MKLLEYEGKDIFEKYQIPISKRFGVLKLGDDPKSVNITRDKCIIKAQVLAGGRGKAGGVKLAKSKEEAREIIEKMLGMEIATHQTKGAALKVKEVLIEEASDIAREIYLSIVLDRKDATAMLIASSEGGTSIEELAHSNPEKIIKIPVDLNEGFQEFQVRELFFKLGFDKKLYKEFSALVKNLCRLFKDIDANLVEINPLVITTAGELLAIDSKIVTDDNALFRHKDLQAKEDHESSEIEKEAKKIGINYIGLDGNIGCMVNGAGLAMATLDTVKLAGGNAANFLDVGGGATVEQITKAFQIILKDKKVKAVLVNIFGGIMKCDDIANGIVEATKK